jgi:DNA-directed RNA polymerase subunit RPC12/RpoP
MHYSYKCKDCGWVSLEMRKGIPCPNCKSLKIVKIINRLEIKGIYYGKEFISFEGSNGKFRELFKNSD